MTDTTAGNTQPVSPDSISEMTRVVTELHSGRISIPDAPESPDDSTSALIAKQQDAITPNDKHRFKDENLSQKLQRIVIDLTDLPITIIAISSALFVAFRLHESRIFGSLVIVAAIFVQIQSDIRSSWILKATACLAYLILHAAYCARRIAALCYGEGYAALTIIVAGTMAILLSYVPALAVIIDKCSGMVTVGFLLAIHVATVFLTSAGIKVWRRFLRIHNNGEHQLPLHRYHRSHPHSANHLTIPVHNDHHNTANETSL